MRCDSDLGSARGGILREIEPTPLISANQFIKTNSQERSSSDQQQDVHYITEPASIHRKLQTSLDQTRLNI